MYNASNLLRGVAGPLLGFQSAVGVLNASAEAIKENELALINLRRVFSGTQTDFKRLGSEMTDFAVKYGDSIANVGKIQEEWAKAGKDTFTDISSLTQATELALNTSDLTNAADAVKYLNSSLIQMEMPAQKAMDLLDSWNKTADKFPADTKDFADAYQRSASYAKNVGLQYNDLNGIISILIERTGRSGEEIGTALRSIFSNIFKPKSIKTLEGLGIQMYQLGENGEKLTNKFRNFPDIISDAAKAFAKFEAEGSSAKVVELTRSLGETWRRNFAIALLEGWNSFDEVKAISEGSAGYSMKKNEMTMQSLAKKAQQLKAALASTAVSVGDSGMLDILKGVTDGATGVLTAFNNMDPAVRDMITVFALLQTSLFGINKGFMMLTGSEMGLGSKIGEFVASLATAKIGKGGYLANKVMEEAMNMTELKNLYADEGQRMAAIRQAMAESGLIKTTDTAAETANTAATEANTAAQVANAEANAAEAASETVETASEDANTAAKVENAGATAAASAVEKAAAATRTSLSLATNLVITGLVLLVYWMATYKKHNVEQMERDMQEFRNMQQKRAEIDATIKSYNQAQQSVDKLNTSINDLKSAGSGTDKTAQSEDELKQKTEQLTQANDDLEQTQLDLARVLPEATTKFNEQGQAMATNIELARELARTQKEGADMAQEALAAKYKASNDADRKELEDLKKKRQEYIDWIAQVSKATKDQPSQGYLFEQPVGGGNRLNDLVGGWSTPEQIAKMGWGKTFNLFNKDLWANQDEYRKGSSIEHATEEMNDLTKQINALSEQLGQGKEAYDELMLAQAREAGKLRESKKETQGYLDVMRRANEVISGTESETGDIEQEFDQNIDNIEKYMSVVARSKNHFSDSYRTAIKSLTDSVPELAKVAASEGKEVGELGVDRIQSITNDQIEIMREGRIQKAKVIRICISPLWL
jgi:TP901 family phage tail tape measure protein